MSTTLLIALIAVVSYLLGSIPFGYLLVRIFRGEDVRQSGSGNIGATNVSRKSPGLGALTLLLDAMKGSVAVGLGYLFSGRMPGGVLPYQAMSMAAFFAVVGHMFPVWLKFRGGKGVATGLGSFVVIAPKAVLVAAVIFIVVVVLSLVTFLSGRSSRSHLFRCWFTRCTRMATLPTALAVHGRHFPAHYRQAPPKHPPLAVRARKTDWEAKRA